MWTKINNSDKERKELLAFFQKFNQLKETSFENGFKNFILVEETEVRLNNSIFDLVKIYEKNLQRLRHNTLEWENLI